MIPRDPSAYQPLPPDLRRELENVKEPKRDDEETMDRSDVEMLFRSIMQFARHLAKKYGFTIKQWPEK